MTKLLCNNIIIIVSVEQHSIFLKCIGVTLLAVGCHTISHKYYISLLSWTQTHECPEAIIRKVITAARRVTGALYYIGSNSLCSMACWQKNLNTIHSCYKIVVIPCVTVHTYLLYCNMSGFFDIQTPKQHVGSNLSMSFYLTDLRGKTPWKYKYE